MMQPLKILFLSAEVAPFAKTGGLADVCGSLPKSLKALGHDVRVVLPAYKPIQDALENGKWDIRAHPLTLQVPVARLRVPAGVLESTLPGSDVPIYFIADWHRFGSRDGVYGYLDDPFRFAFFSRAALDLAVAAMEWRPDVVHAHDWHAAPAVTWLATAGQSDSRYANMPTVYTIHNLQHHGEAPWGILDYLELITHGLNEEKFGQVDFMARGIFHATMINTVSPTYSREIRTYEGGSGLDNLLRFRDFDVHGILNGIDYDIWNPMTDKRLPVNYNVKTLDERIANKRALQARAGLPQRDDVPLVAMVTRLAWQKGLDISGEVFHRLMNNWAGEAQCVILGAGDPRYEDMLRHLAGYHNQKMTAFIGFDADLAHLIYGGSDMFLMPSLFEPCGLGQMIAMRYGSVPVVRSTGGLADTVDHGTTGFEFGYYSSDSFWDGLAEALYVYNADPQRWKAIQRNGMEKDYSWDSSAKSYEQLYQWAISRVRGW